MAVCDLETTALALSISCPPKPNEVFSVTISEAAVELLVSKA